MSIEELGSIGEFVSAIIIVVSLIYIALQSKQTHRLMQSTAFQARTATTLDLYRQAATSPELAEIMVKNTAGEELTANERLRIQFWQRCFLKTAENIHFQLELGVIDPEFAETLDGLPNAVANNRNGLGETWEIHKNEYRKPFQEFIEERL